MLNYPDYPVVINGLKRSRLRLAATESGSATFTPEPGTPVSLQGRQIELPLPQLPEPARSVFHGLENLSDEELEARFGSQIRSELAEYGYDDEEAFGNPIRRQERLLRLYRQLDSWASELSDSGLEYLDVNELLDAPWDEAVQAAIINVISRVSTPSSN